METNLNNELFLSTNYNMFFKFEDLKNYINDENINKLKFFEVKENVKLQNTKTIKFKDLDLSLDYIYRDFKSYHLDLQSVEYFKNSIKILKSNFKVLNKLSIDFYKDNIICFDIEALEEDQNKILEIGWATIKNKELKVEHYIVQEHLDLRNGKFVEDNKDNFLFGKSIILPQKEIVKILKKELDLSDIIIGQGIGNDFKYLSKINNEIKFQDYNNKVIDNGNNISRLINKNGCSIKKACILFNIEAKYLHNAGNDAFYNLKIIDSIINEYKDKFDIMFNELNNKLEIQKEKFKSKWIDNDNSEVLFER